MTRKTKANEAVEAEQVTAVNQPTPQAVVPMTSAMVMLEREYSLPLTEIRRKLVMPANARPNDEMLREAVELARSAGVPLWGINLIPTRLGIAPYINSNGIKFRLANDPRGVASNTFEVINFSSVMGEVQIIRRTIVMGNGQTYQGLGAVVIDRDWNPGNALLKADTKANRRAGYDAIANAVGMRMYDEDADRATNESIEASFRVIVAKTPTNLVEFFTWVENNDIKPEAIVRAGTELYGPDWLFEDMTDEQSVQIAQHITNTA